MLFIFLISSNTQYFSKHQIYILFLLEILFTLYLCTNYQTDNQTQAVAKHAMTNKHI